MSRKRFFGTAPVDTMLSLTGIDQVKMEEFILTTVVGESGGAKSTLVAILSAIAYRESMKILTGKESTTPYLMNVAIDPKAVKAAVCVYLKSKEQLKEFTRRNLKISLVKELKNIISSMPKSNKAIKEFVEKAVNERMYDEDRKFKVSKLLCHEGSIDDYTRLMTELIMMIIHHVDDSFRNQYLELKSKSAPEAKMLLEVFIDQILTLASQPMVKTTTEGNVSIETVTSEESSNTVTEFIDIIYEEGIKCLMNANFEKTEVTDLYIAKELSSEELTICLRAVTNSAQVNYRSAACLIDTMVIRVPGPGIVNTSDGKEAPYIICDVIGFSNDGYEEVDLRTKEALLQTLQYDIIVYVGRITTISAIHSGYLKSIFKTMRPAKLLVALTYCDKDDLFDSEVVPSEYDILQMISGHKKNMIQIIKQIGITDAPVIMPDVSDIICFANKVLARLGESANTVFSDKPYNLLRDSISNGYSQVRRRIHVQGLVRGVIFMKPEISISVQIGIIVGDLTAAINKEIGDMKARSINIHHWTLEALLWKYLYGGEHISSAMVWDNVTVKTFSNIVDICYRSFGNIKFDGSMSIINSTDADHIRSEFNANLLSELRRAAWLLILRDPKDAELKSDCYDNIRILALTPKYNKWSILNELQKVLLKAVTDREYLMKLLDSAFSNACDATYNRIIY